MKERNGRNGIDEMALETMHSFILAPIGHLIHFPLLFLQSFSEIKELHPVVEKTFEVDEDAKAKV